MNDINITYIDGTQKTYSQKSNVINIVSLPNFNKIESLDFGIGYEYIYSYDENSSEAEEMADLENLKHVKLPIGLKAIGIGCFSFSSIETLDIPETVTEIQKFAFFMSKIKKINLPNHLEKINEYAFAYCDNLKSVHMPYSVKKLGEYAFRGCKNLESVRISKNIHEIERGTFENCTSLKNVNIPSSIKSVAAFAFYNTPFTDNLENEKT